MAIYDTVGPIELKQCPNPVVVYKSEGTKLHILARTYGPALVISMIMMNLTLNFNPSSPNDLQVEEIW